MQGDLAYMDLPLAVCLMRLGHEAFDGVRSGVGRANVDSTVHYAVATYAQYFHELKGTSINESPNGRMNARCNSGSLRRHENEEVNRPRNRAHQCEQGLRGREARRERQRNLSQVLTAIRFGTGDDASTARQATGEGVQGCSTCPKLVKTNSSVSYVNMQCSFRGRQKRIVSHAEMARRHVEYVEMEFRMHMHVKEGTCPPIPTYKDGRS